MASNDILSRTLSSITPMKLDEISSLRSTFEDGKAVVLQAVSNEAKQSEKLRILIDRIESLASMRKNKNNKSIFLNNIKQFLRQAQHDPSISEGLLNKSLKRSWTYIRGSMTAEDSAASDDESFESMGRKEMHEQREKWDNFVFEPLEADTAAINSYLTKLFTSTAGIKYAWHELRDQTRAFEKLMESETHFDENSLEW